MILIAKRRMRIRQMRITTRRYINFLFIFLIILAFSSHNVQAQSQQTDSNPSMTIPDMQWVELNLSGTPPNGLRDYAVGYINSNNKLVIFGGTTQGGAKSGSTYLLDFNQMSWVPPNPPSTANTTTPGARSNMVYGIDVYSSYRQQLVITTGLGNDGKPFNDTWAFDMNYQSWRQITNVQTPNGPVPNMYDAIGGTDLEAQGGISTKNSMWVTLGTDGTNKYQDTWRLVLDGVSSPNVDQLNASWYKLTTSGNIPPVKLNAAGTVLPGGHIAMFGGCNTMTSNCATRDAYVESIQNYQDPTPTSARPSWLNASQCPGPRSGAAMTMNYNRANPAFENQVILFGGEGTSQSGNGVQGEVNILDVSAGTWVRVLPKPDPKSAKQYPRLRAGAQMLALPKAVYKSNGIPDGTDIFLFGGEALDGSGEMLSDVWLLRLSNTPIKRGASDGTKFLQCDVGDGTGVDNTSGIDGNNGSTTSADVTISTISFVLLPLAISILRFGTGHMGGLTAILYGFTIISSYVTAFLGFGISKTKEYSTTHRILGLIILILLYAIVPLASIISWGVRRKYESNSSATHPEGTRAKAKTKGFIPKMAALFQFGDSTDYTKATEKSFQVDRRESNGRNTNNHSRDDGNWFDKRKSVSISDTPTLQNDGSSRDSLNNDIPRRGSTAASTVQPNSLVLGTRHAHHIFSQLILLLGAIYVAISLSNENSVKGFWVALFIVYMGVMYVIWIAAAWRGYPRGRRSLLVAFLGKYCHGNGEFDDNEEEEYNNDTELVNPWVNNNTQLRHVRDEEELDEEAQAQMEEEMANREVVVMTIPKRRLTVVNV